MNKTDTSVVDDAKSMTPPKTKAKSSALMKSFWGLIGLLAVGAAGLISMAVMALNQHTYVDTTQTKKVDENAVEIIDLAGNSRVVSGSLLPANPVGEDESVVKAGTDDADAQAAQQQLAKDASEGKQLVESVKPVEVEKKTQVAAKEVEKQVAKAEVAKPKVDKKVHQEANAQMDNLF